MTISNTIWITSDWHFSHNNICKGSTKWEHQEACRPFSCSKEMDEVILDNLNAKAKPKHTIIVLGDLVLGSKNKISAIIEYRKHILCENIFWIRGNHDPHDHYQELRPHFSGIYDIWHTKLNGQGVTLCHYAMLTWPKQHHGTWNLYGHSHGSLPDNPNLLGMDCGVDCHPDGFYPFSWDEIKAHMAQKKWTQVDHHNPMTS